MVKQYLKRSWLNLVLFIISYIAVVGIVQFIGIFISGVDLTAATQVQQSTAQQLVMTLFGLLGTFLVLFSFMKWVDKVPFSNLGLQWPNHKWDIVVGVIVGLVMMTIGFGTLVFLKQIQFAITPFSAYELVLSGMLFLGIALMEELVWRGYILRNLMNACHHLLALLISASLFSLIHAANPNMSWVSFLNLFLSGLVLGIPYMYTRNLWFSIALHFSWNFFQSLLGFNVSGQDAYSLIEITANENNDLHGGTFGFEGSMLLLALQVILILLFFIYFERRPKQGKNKAVLV